MLKKVVISCLLSNWRRALGEGPPAWLCPAPERRLRREGPGELGNEFPRELPRFLGSQDSSDAGDGWRGAWVTRGGPERGFFPPPRLCCARRVPEPGCSFAGRDGSRSYRLRDRRQPRKEAIALPGAGIPRRCRCLLPS